MASNTPNLNLYKKNPIEDQNDTFNIDTMLNDNWDKIDDAIGDIENELTTADSIKTIYESNGNTNGFTDAEKSKLAGIEDDANNYQHPTTHPASMIDEETDRKFITSSEKTKLAGIESSAEVNNISDTNAGDLTDGGNSSLHYHANDRNRANHTGTQSASTISNFISTVRETVLTGLSTATNSAITATDNILSALGKLQAQINNKADTGHNHSGTYEPVITKKTGFNLNKSDSVTSTSATVLATSKAAKTAYDKGVQALNTANTKLNSSGGSITGDLSVQGNIKLTSNDSMVMGSEGNDYLKFNPDTDALEIYSNSAKTLEVSGSTIEYEGHNIWHAGNDGSGSGLDADVVDGKHASGTLNTIEKANLVNAINEVNSKTIALETEISNNINQQSLTLTNADPTQHITARQNCGVDVEVAGEMVVNGFVKNALEICKLSRCARDSYSDGRAEFTLNTDEGFGYVAFNSYIDGFKNTYKPDTYYFAVGVGENISGITSFKALSYSKLVVDATEVNNNPSEGRFAVKAKAEPSFDGEPYVYMGLHAYGSNGSRFALSDVMYIEITETEYNNLTVDQLLAKYSYTNSAQPLLNPTVEVCGKNLFNIHGVEAGYNSSGGITHGVTFNIHESKLIGKAESSTGFFASYKCLVKKGLKYTLKLKKSIASYYSTAIYEDRLWGTGIETSDITDGVYNTVSFVSSTGTAVIGFYFIATTPIATSVILEEIQLELGDTATTYEPYKGGQIIFPTELAKIDTYQDKLTYKDGVAKVDREVKHVVLDGSKDWEFGGDYTGFKRIRLPNVTPKGMTATEKVTKYNGGILKHVAWVWEEADITRLHSDGYLYITIADTDSGWGEGFEPNADEIKAYFNGWKMYNQAASWDTPYNNTGTQAWGKRDDNNNYVSNSVVFTVPTTEAYEGIFKPYQLYYALQEPIQEEIQPIILGDGVNLVEGQNTLTVKSGVVWEKANPVYANDSHFYWINNKANLTKEGKFKYKVEKIIDICKKNYKKSDFNNWDIVMNNNDSYGKGMAYIKPDKFDPQATYYVLYEVLQEDYNCQVQTAAVSFEDNVRGTVNELVETVSNNESDISVLTAYLSQLEERIKVLE